MSLATWLRTPSTSRDTALLTAAVAVLYLVSGSHPALGSSTRYVESCREMVERGDWVVPYLGYVPYLEKPILAYWLGAISRLLFGGSDLAAQAPAALSALVTVLAVYGMGRQLRDRVFGLAAGLLLLGCGLFLGMTSTLTTDMPLTACLAVAWWAWMRWDGERAAGGLGWLCAFWTALGLGVLAKGPVAIILAGTGIGGFALLAQGWRGVFTTLWAMRPVTGVAIIAAINLPWSIAVWQRDPRLLEFFYVRINYEAFFDGDINHPGPVWYYLPVLIVALMPFSLAALPAWVAGVVAALRLVWTRTALDVAACRRLYLACVALFPLLFLSCAASKLGTYILPLLPLVVLLALEQILHGFRAWSRRLLVVTAALSLLVVALVPVAVPVLRSAGAEHRAATLMGMTIDGLDPVDLAAVDWSWLPVVGFLAVALALAMIAALVALRRDRVGLALAAIGGGLALVMITVLPNLDRIIRDLDATRLIAVIRARGGDDPSVAPERRDPVIIQQDVIHRYELDYALGRRAGILDRARERAMGHFIEVTGRDVPLPRKRRNVPEGQPNGDPYHLNGDTMPDHPWLWSHARLKQAWAGPQRIWMLCEDDQPRRLAAVGIGPVHVIDRARFAVLISNQP